MYKITVSRMYKDNKFWVVWDVFTEIQDKKPRKKVWTYTNFDDNLKCKDVITRIEKI